jgi:hypothetical protein
VRTLAALSQMIWFFVNPYFLIKSGKVWILLTLMVAFPMFRPPLVATLLPSALIFNFNESDIPPVEHGGQRSRLRLLACCRQMG